MKPFERVLLIFCAIVQRSSTFNADTLERTLVAIEYLISVKPGAFSCVFYDVAPQYPHDNILDAILKSPRLDHVAKYVVDGSERNNVYKLPWNPSLLLLHTGNNVSHLESFDVIVDMFYFMFLFDPATKMLVFVDELYTPAMIQMQGHVYYASFNYFVYIGDTSKDVYQCNGVYCWNRPREQHPMYLFSYCRRSMQGRNITYIKNERVLTFAWNSKWLNETARYLNTTTVEYPHNCEASDEAYQQCYQDHAAGNGADILLLYMTFDIPDASGIKLYEDLEHNPQFVVDSVLKRFVAQGTRTEFHETRPGAAVYWNSDYVDVFKDVAIVKSKKRPPNACRGYKTRL
ncbi:conserved hypothetical protein [Culex quinquefasciatus]|uniref:Secreted protein n=1 Tax=Culex quinquefasciatus TaxID=7176 RepID=B0XKV9_CULQU|nr:conserved hypothetical protein [Culex quinquefasciatus]|eukprot:XP_001870281.1 conserved hypothetical protein [Culex quinquefasciatus]